MNYVFISQWKLLSLAILIQGHCDLVSCCVSRFVSWPSLIQRSYERLQLNGLCYKILIRIEWLNDLFIRSYTSNFLLVIVRILHMLNVTCQWSRSYCNLLESKKVVGNFESMKPLMMHSCIVLLFFHYLQHFDLDEQPRLLSKRRRKISIIALFPFFMAIQANKKNIAWKLRNCRGLRKRASPLDPRRMLGFWEWYLLNFWWWVRMHNMIQTQKLFEQTCIECLQHVHIFWNINTLVRKTIFQDKTCAAVVCWGSRSFCAREERSQKDACKQRKLKIIVLRVRECPWPCFGWQLKRLNDPCSHPL